MESEIIPFDQDAVLGSASRLLQSRGEIAAARLLASAHSVFRHARDSSYEVEAFVLRLAIPTSLYAQLTNDGREQNQLRIREAVREVLGNFEDVFLSGTSIVPELTTEPDWREKVIADEPLPNAQKVPVFFFWTRDTSPYEILGVTGEADEEELASALRRRRHQCHPDLNQAHKDEAHEATIRAQEAHDELLARRSSPF